MRVALVHEWLVGYAGSEKVLEAIASLYPQAPIHALLHDPRALVGTPLADRRVVTSFLQRLPGSRRHHRLYLPLMPLAVEQFDVGDVDVVISSNHAVAKGVLTRADQLHISYIHTPMRYAWDLYHEHIRATGLAWRAVARPLMHYLRLWDRLAADRVDVLVANSHYVARRVRKAYGRDAAVIHPPVDVERFAAAMQPRRDDFYLVVSRLVPYKRVDAIVQALGGRGELVVIGDGPERGRLEKLAGPRVRLLGAVDDATVAEHMGRCRALIQMSDEDFGITVVEAQAAGAPVIAYGRGGATETVIDGESGILFNAQTPASLAAALERFESLPADHWDPIGISSRNSCFSRARFTGEFARLVERAWDGFAPSGLTRGA
jgi:glycosyltransferase involved in cell wall biosynthesis